MAIGVVDGDIKEKWAKLLVDKYTMEKFVSTLEEVENELSIVAFKMKALRDLYKRMKWVAFDQPDKEREEEKAMQERVDKLVKKSLEKESKL